VHHVCFTLSVTKRVLAAALQRPFRRTQRTTDPKTLVRSEDPTHYKYMARKRSKPSVIALVVAVGALGTLAARRAGYSGMGGNTVVRCRDGHLFTTIWIPFASVKSIRLGMKRFQHCPVGSHWTLVTPVKDAELTDEDKQFAAEHRDVRIP
jgi:hypothetical protein